MIDHKKWLYNCFIWLWLATIIIYITGKKCDGNDLNVVRHKM